MRLIYDNKDELIGFGMRQIKKSLEEKGLFYVEEFVNSVNSSNPEHGIIVQKAKKGKNSADHPKESFRITRTGGVVTIEGADSRGLMYGCLEWAERISRGAELADGGEIFQKPALAMRGVKFNLPYAPFAVGDPFKLNEETCMSMDFWHSYIDMLAMNRYNCLSLWSEHPFHLMVVSQKYRNANPYSDIQADRNIRFFRELFQYAKNRGIDIIIFTWNIMLPYEAAKGLGLTDALGEYNYSGIRWEEPLNTYRRTSPLIKDYFKEMVLQLLLTYPELKGLGVSASEWMDGSALEREQWIVDTYISAIKESGRKITFVHRTNMQSAGDEIKKLVMGAFEKEDFYVSWKYSLAHCHSHPEPQFEKLWHAWDGVDMENTQVLFTVRNDDYFTHRWGDPEYIRAYVKGMLKPYVKGYYWGADGYVWAKDFQHVDGGHKTWSYDHERHELEFILWGRISYDPDLDPDVWRSILEKRYGKQFADRFHLGLTNASKIIPAVNRQFWLDYDFQWNPEGCFSAHGFKTILDFVNSVPMPGVGTLGIKEYTQAEMNGTLEKLKKEYQETPPDILHILKEASKKSREIAEDLDNTLGDFKAGHAACTLFDLYAWAEMGSYYECKISAAMDLNRYSLSKDSGYKTKAVEKLKEALSHWEKLGYYWSLHNKPYMMARVGRIFGYPYYIENVKNDIRLAEEF